MEPLATLHSEALRQGQVIARSQARALGWSDSTIWVSGLRTATPIPRALADHSGHSTANALAFLIADACRLRLCTLEQVSAELESRARFPGRPALGEAVRQLTGELSHSRYERLGRRLLREAGLRFHPKPFLVENQGRKVAEIDIAEPRLHYGVEVDGPLHLMADVAAKDRARDRRLGRLGWTIDRYLWTDIVEQPRRFVNEVRARLAQLEFAVK